MMYVYIDDFFVDAVATCQTKYTEMLVLYIINLQKCQISVRVCPKWSPNVKQPFTEAKFNSGLHVSRRGKYEIFI